MCKHPDREPLPDAEPGSKSQTGHALFVVYPDPVVDRRKGDIYEPRLGYLSTVDRRGDGRGDEGRWPR